MACLFAIALQAFLWNIAVSPAAAQEVDAGSSAVPLAEALRRFAKESGYDVVFPEELVAGKRAAPVRDARNAYQALSQMLAGSGLVPRFTRRDAFVLEAAAPEVGAADISLDPIEVLASPWGDSDADYRWYGDRLLEASLSVLRRSRELGLKTYDFTLFVWLSDDGRIVNLEGAGSAEHQEALVAAKQVLLGLIVGTAPPGNMPQPVGLRIVSQ